MSELAYLATGVFPATARAIEPVGFIGRGGILPPREVHGMAQKPLWRCSVCGREFAKFKQWHSCRPVPVDSHFEGKPQGLRKLFDHLCRELKRFGPLRIDAVKSGINLIPKHHMGGVRVLKDRLQVGFLLSRRVEGPRIIRTQKVGPAAHTHAVDLSSKPELDNELLSWLKEAYQRAAHK